MITANVIRHYPSPPPPHKIGEVEIPQNSKNLSPSYLRSFELSSPEMNYDINVHYNHPIPIVSIQHRKTDKKRHQLAKDRIATLEERLRKLEEKEKQREEVEKKRQEEEEKQREEVEKQRQEEEKQREEVEKKRQEEEVTIYGWETCNRIAQGINDFLRRAVKSMQDPTLTPAQDIWTMETKYRYLPVLFTTWWIYWNAIDAQKYPLPSAFNSLQPSERETYKLHKLLPDYLERGAGALWYSKYQPLIEVMLAAYHARPKGRNIIQHPTPSTYFAHNFVRSSNTSLSKLSSQSKKFISAVIESGISSGSNHCEPLFSHSSGDTFSGLELDERLETILQSDFHSGLGMAQ